MTKQEWFDCKDVNELLDQVENLRKLKLFALVCCRSIEHFMPDQRSKDCLEKLELFIDGKIDEKELELARQNTWQNTWHAPANAAWSANAVWAVNAVNAAASVVASIVWSDSVTNAAANTAANAAWAAGVGAKQTEQLKQLDFLRDIYNPFLLDIKFSQQAISLAEQVYEGEDKARGVLSDYLEEQGYPAEVVSHFKSGFHPKGCWLIDQILGKH